MNTSILILLSALSGILVGGTGCTTSRQVSGAEFIQLSQPPKPGEQLSFWNGNDGYYYLECYRVSTKSKLQKRWAVRTPARNLRTSDVERLEEVNFKSAPEKLRFAPPDHPTTSASDVSGLEFVQKVEGRGPGEKVVLRRDDRAGYYYADWYLMPPTQSVFKLEKRLRVSIKELNSQQFETLKNKLAQQDGNWPYPK